MAIPDHSVAHSIGHGIFASKVVGTRGGGAGHRAELILEDALPSVEVTLPLERPVVKGQELLLNQFTMRLFPAR